MAFNKMKGAPGKANSKECSRDMIIFDILSYIKKEIFVCIFILRNS
jgi:hypothetical protein